MHILLTLYETNNQEIWLQICLALMTTEVCLTAYAVGLTAIAYKECSALTSFPNTLTVNYHTSVAKNKIIQSKGIRLTLAV